MGNTHEPLEPELELDSDRLCEAADVLAEALVTRGWLHVADLVEAIEVYGDDRAADLVAGLFGAAGPTALDLAMERELPRPHVDDDFTQILYGASGGGVTDLRRAHQLKHARRRHRRW